MMDNTNLEQDAEAQKYKDTLSCIKELCLEEREMCCGECGNYNVAERVLNIIEPVLDVVKPALNSIDGAAEGVTAK